ncbi:hypothetical protein [Sulfobacillus harzensis]|uniref:Uncharacterized protein n=1 Tax=Sulfobacillus harzensis TaxID=2729629 RepID=A0A7Y0Q4D0_9FIRM|nr:hypothetical protein [Sulfobacillus harzensis]NMP23119.1 hypothetical protein [Sulfobacillus harzensis]
MRLGTMPMRNLRRLTPKQLLAGGAVFGLAIIAVLILGRNWNPHAIGNMPGPVQQVLDTPTLSGNDIFINMLQVTGHQGDISRGILPGDYSWGPTSEPSDNVWYVDFEVPVNLSGIAKQLGYPPPVSRSSISSGNPESGNTVAFDDYVRIKPLPNEASDRLYFDPDTRMAKFSFKLDANGMVMDESWDAVTIDS